MGTGDATPLHVGHGLPDPVWDSFAERAVVTHYKQSAAWARFKAAHGWTAHRIHVTDGTEILTGVQVLIRSLRVAGSVAHIARGPLVSPGGPVGLDLVLDELERLCRSERVQYLAISPASATDGTEGKLCHRGLQPNDRLSGVTTTGRIDLSVDEDVLLARMRKSTRANVRRGHARGLRARVGTKADLDLFFALLSVASRRKRFTTFSETRIRRMWRELSTDEHAVIFVVEADDEAVSAQLAIPYGDTFYSHLQAWSGRHGDRKPNELLDWTALTWAKQHGYRYYDFEGVSMQAASPRRPDVHVSDYKRGFGVEVVALPRTYERVSNPVLRWAYTSALPKLEGTAGFDAASKVVLRAISGGRQGPGTSV